MCDSEYQAPLKMGGVSGPIKHYCLGEPDELAKAINAVANQGKKQ